MNDKWLGYVRPDGNVGARNHCLLLSGTVYANSVIDRVCATTRGTVGIVHPLGRCQSKPDLRMTFNTLVGTGKNPNAGAVIVVDHFREEGCTADDIAHEIAKTGKPVEVVNIRNCGGSLAAQLETTRKVSEMVRVLSAQKREEVGFDKFLFGLNCGTSDTSSGLASNPALGKCSDKVVSLGGRSILAEVLELMGAEEWLASKAVSPEVGQKIRDYIAHFERRALATGEDIRGSQPTGDNIIGGLSTIEEKSLGGAKKSGSAPIIDGIWYAEAPSKTPGLYVMYTPGHGSESITGIAAAGAQALVFSTGGGHTIAHPLMPTIKITGNAVSFDKMKDTVELDLSGILRGELSLDQAGEVIFNELRDVLSGKLTKCEIIKDETGFAIHRVGPSI